MPRKKKTTSVKKTSRSKARAAENRMSALDAAAEVLASAKEPLSARQLIEQMAARGYWSSPVGRTPWSTLAAAIGREIKTKGKGSRFKKTARGRFARRAGV